MSFSFDAACANDSEARAPRPCRRLRNGLGLLRRGLQAAYLAGETPSLGRSTMPPPSPVLDHVVVDVHDRIDEALHRFSALGFELTPRGRHTLGSVNHLAMFATDYLELLGFAADAATRPEITRFPLGLNGLVFKTADADLVHREAKAAGLPVLPGAILLAPRRPGRDDARCAVSHHPARSGQDHDRPRLFLRAPDPRPGVAARVAEPPQRRLRDRARGGRGRRSAAHRRCCSAISSTVMR